MDWRERGSRVSDAAVEPSASRLSKSSSASSSHDSATSSVAFDLALGILGAGFALAGPSVDIDSFFIAEGISFGAVVEVILIYDTEIYTGDGPWVLMAEAQRRAGLERGI